MQSLTVYNHRFTVQDSELKFTCIPIAKFCFCRPAVNLMGSLPAGIISLVWIANRMDSEDSWADNGSDFGFVLELFSANFWCRVRAVNV